MNPSLAALLLGGGVVTGGVLSYESSVNRVFDASAPVTRPVAKTSIILCAYHEPTEFLKTALESLHEQSIVKQYPEMFEIITAGCEGINLDLAWDLSDKIVCAQPGKLTARMEATKVASGCLIVSADADTFYPPSWLNQMLKPFSDPKVVATTSFSVQRDAPMTDRLLHWVYVMEHYEKIFGRSSAYWKESFYAVGGFDTSINQKDISQILNEEEYHFRKKLLTQGDVRFVFAPVVHLSDYHSNRGLRYGET